MKVKDVMETNPYLLYEEDTVLHASKFMKEERIRNLPVADKEKKLVGLITLREIIETFFENPDKILVRDAMIKIVASVKPDTELKEAIKIMMSNKYGCLPVIDDNNTLLGIISEATLLKVLYDFSTLPASATKGN